MAITGVLLWLNDWILAHLPHPATILDVSTAIHFYEAILATAAIVIWHFYAVIFDPDVYPVKWTFLTGRAPEHELREQTEENRPEQSSPAIPGPAQATPHPQPEGDD
jgi:hypothetical protein